MKIIIGALGILGVVIVIMSISSFFLLPLQIWLKTIRVRSLPSIFGLFFFGILLIVPGFIYESGAGSGDKNFVTVSNSIFNQLHAAGSIKSLTVTKTFGSITYHSPSTIQLVSSDTSIKEESFTIDPKALPLSITGSFSPGFQSWCFVITDGNRHSVYDQFGIATSNLASHTTITNPQKGHCSKGRAYAEDGTIEP